MQTETQAFVFVSEDEGTSSEPPKTSGATVEELEEEIRELENSLKKERDERKKAQITAQEEMEREVRMAEEVWMERARQAMQERDSLAARTAQMEEQLDSIRLDVNRAVAYRLEMEESRNRIKSQLENVQRDYEETMMERSTVLEENQRLAEERDHLRKTVHSLGRTVDDLSMRTHGSEVEDLKRQLEQMRRQLHATNEETASANRRYGEAEDHLARTQEQLRLVTAERDEAQRRMQDAETEREPIVDVWLTQSVDVALPFPKPNLGIVLSGGKGDGRFAVHSPVYVKDVLSGSPLEHCVRRLDHILMVNDIDVTDMDQRSVIDILKNSHHLKMVIRRRANEHKIHEIGFASGHEIGVELGNGVFINSVESAGAAARAGVFPGTRLVHVNHVPVYDAKHAEHLIKYSTGSLIVGVLDGKKRNENKENKQRTLFAKLFGRGGEKPRPVVAKASIAPEGAAFLRQGSLRIPAPQPTQLVRYGSLRAPPGSMAETRFSEHLEHIWNKNPSRMSAHSEVASSAWPKSVPEEIVPRRRLNRPSVFPVFANSPATSRHSRQSADVSLPWSPRETPRPIARRPSYERRSVTSPIHSYNERVSCYSPALPQPPPYPGPRDVDSLSSLLSSTNSLPIPGPSSYHNYTNNSPCGTLMSESSDKVRRVHLSREGNEFGLGLENNHNGGVVISNVQGRTSGVVRRGDRLLDVGGINMRSADKESAARVLNQFGASQDEVAILVSSSSPRWIQVPRKSIRLCGGNAIGILAEAPAGDLQEGDLILEIDGFNVRGATLEEATEALLESLSEMAELLIEDGGDRLNRLRLGADGDSFYVRVNVDRNSENKDELDIRAGEIVFVDKTLFMGQRGRWRAWKMDREGRQRENGIIPSASQMEALEQKKKGKARAVLSRAIYERMERVSSAKRRPVVLFGPLLAPFIQALLDDPKFINVVPECRALQALEVERQLHCCELVEARRRDKLFDVISAVAVTNAADQCLHCIVDLSAAGVQRLHQLRVYPILIRLKFKSAKQVKDMKEDFGGEKLSSKAAKELVDRASAADSELETLGLQATVIQVNSQGPARSILKHVCQQISAHVEHEQKKTIWVAMS